MLVLTLLSSFAGAETEKIHVFVSIPPQAYFVKRVGGEYIDVEVLVSPGNSLAAVRAIGGTVVPLDTHWPGIILKTSRR